MDQVPNFFRDYDIRATDDKLTPEVMERIGKALGTYSDKEKFVVGRDPRISSPQLKKALIKGLKSCGKEVHDLDLVPFGPTQFYGWRKGLEIAYVTASHLSQEWNGVKFYHSNGIGYFASEIEQIGLKFSQENFQDGKNGAVKEKEVKQNYINYLLEKADFGDFNKDIILDCGNGSAGVVAPELFEAAEFDLETLFKDPDGNFPNRSSKVTEDSAKRLKEVVKNYDAGIAYDGDSDRVSVVDDKGRLLSTEQTSWIILDYLLKHEKGDIVATVACSQLIDDIAEKYNREVKRVKVGHTYLFQEVLNGNYCYGVEDSGHIAIPGFLPLDDGISNSFYFAEALTHLEGKLSEKVDEIPHYSVEKASFSCPDSEKFKVVNKIKQKLEDNYSNTSDIDGIRVRLEKGWVLIRASNTSPKIKITVETDSESETSEIVNKFTKIIEREIEDLEV